MAYVGRQPLGVPNDGSVTTSKLANDAVTYTKIQNVSATDKILGRATAGAGDVEEIACTSFARTLLDDADAATARATLGVGAPFVNKIINGVMGIDQRNNGSAQTITAAAALAYTVDRWYAYCTGANVTGQRVAGTAPNQFNYRFTGAASVTKIGFAQRIEAANSQDLAGTTATISVDLANSLLTTVTWTAWYANTADTFGTLASPTRTQIATGTLTVNSTLTRYNTQISIPSAATTGIEIEFSVGAQTSGTWTIGRVQLELGSVATPFEHRPYGTELALCQRYYQIVLQEQGFNAAAGGHISQVTINYPTPMRASPSSTNTSAGTLTNASAASLVVRNSYGGTFSLTASAAGYVAAENRIYGLAVEL